MTSFASNREGYEKMDGGRFLFVFALLSVVSGGVANAQQENGSGPFDPDIYNLQNNRHEIVRGEKYANYFGGGMEGQEKEPFDPFFEVDWSVGVIAASRVGSSPGRNTISLNPQFSLTNIGLRSQFSLGANALFSTGEGQSARVETIALSYEGEYEIDGDSRLNSSINIDLNQGDAKALGVLDNVVELPLVFSARGEGGIGRRFGRLGILGAIQLERELQTPTLLRGNIERDNSDQSFTSLGATLRASYEITPNIAGFVAGDLKRNWYDAASIATGTRLDGWNWGLRGGVQLNWRDVLVSEFSIGYGLRSFDDPSIARLGGAIFGVDVNYTPDSVLNAGVQLSTGFTPANASDSLPSSVDYRGSVNVGYRLNRMIGLRASATGEWVRPVSGIQSRTSIGAGAGFDFTVNKNLLLNADYSYNWIQRLPDAGEYEHALILGMRFSR